MRYNYKGFWGCKPSLVTSRHKYSESRTRRSAVIASKWLARTRTFQMVLLQGGAGFVPVDNVDELPGVS